LRKFFTWLGIGLIGLITCTCGAKTGQGRYREIKVSLVTLWNDPRVKKAPKQAHKQADNAPKSATKKAKKIGR